MLLHEEILQDIWSDDQNSPISRALAVLFRGLSIPYAVTTAARNRLYDWRLLPARKLPCPVISIGNLTTGGTGKTPLTITLCRLLREKGYKPAVLSRGYGRTGQAKVAPVSDGKNILMDPRTAGDEPYLMAQLLPGVPIIVGASRFGTGKWALDTLGVNILVLDDGFQHRQLYRDVDILLLGKKRPFGNGYLLPRGALREAKSGLERAGIIVTTGEAPAEQKVLPLVRKKKQTKVPPQFHGTHRPVGIIGPDGTLTPPACLKGKKVYAFAGMGNPQSFRHTLECLGATIVSFAVFGDHHPYTSDNVERIVTESKQLGADLILTTEKDGARLHDYPELLEMLSYVRIEMNITPSGRKLLGQILKMIEKHPKAGR